MCLFFIFTLRSPWNTPLNISLLFKNFRQMAVSSEILLTMFDN